MHFTWTASCIFRVRHRAFLWRQPHASFVHRTCIFISTIYFFGEINAMLAFTIHGIAVWDIVVAQFKLKFVIENELAYRLSISHGCHYIFLMYWYITIHVCVPHFYDLPTLVGCWSSVSIRMIMHMAFVVSEKVGYPLTGWTTPVGWLLILKLTALSRSAIVV